ncbi:Uncharacterised protein [Pseudomonas aeruginosa]|nr:Uncharacterised protein [Pseudomonas aeruginosa]
MSPLRMCGMESEMSVTADLDVPAEQRGGDLAAASRAT